MFKPIITWDIYEVKTISTPVNGVMLRGRIRKLGLENKRNILVENTEDAKGLVRFAVPSGEDTSIIQDYLHNLMSDVTITLVKENIPNPILSKLRVNDESRYTL